MSLPVLKDTDQANAPETNDAQSNPKTVQNDKKQEKANSDEEEGEEVLIPVKPSTFQKSPRIGRSDE